MATLSIRRPALSRAHVVQLAAFAVAWGIALLSVGVVWLRWAPGGDAHAYWDAWHAGMYVHRMALDGVDAYLYSPAFAAAIWPLAQLPWSAFYVLWELLAFATWVWLLRPLGVAIALPLVIACQSLTIVGNIEWLLALAAAISLRWPSAWAVALLTKASTGVGVIWYAVRGEWRRFGIALATVGAAVVLTAWLPWGEWLSFLLSQHGSGMVWDWSVPIWPRLALAAAMTAWGARGGRTWVIPTSMILASPVISLQTCAILAAVPRLRQRPAEPADR